MRLTVYTDYTLRILMYLGLKGEERATIKEISDCYGISKNHLMKIVQDLSHEGVLKTVRGKSGGLALARAPEEICIGDIVRLTEPDFRLVECFGEGPVSCRLNGSCILTTAFDEALEAFLEVLDGYTLADLIKPKRRLRHLLELTTPIPS
ncbi:MAG: Rrf2 family transcriptional regulator [Kiloniellaceae bacterium]